MAFAEYVARRSLAPGHVIDTPYTLILPSLARCDMSRERQSRRQVSLSGRVETLWYHAKRVWQVQTEPVLLDEAELLIEFLESVDDGQSFTFDPYGKPDARSDLALVVVSDDQGYRMDRAITRGLGGSDDWFEFSFGVREL